VHYFKEMKFRHFLKTLQSEHPKRTNFYLNSSSKLHLYFNMTSTILPSYPKFSLFTTSVKVGKDSKRQSYGSALSRKDRRRLQRTELVEVLSEINFYVYIMASQFRDISTEGPSKNVLIETNSRRIVLHMTLQKAKDLYKRFKTGILVIKPVLTKGSGQGQVGTQFKGCFLRLRPMKSSRVELVAFVDREDPIPAKLKGHDMSKNLPAKVKKEVFDDASIEGAKILMLLHKATWNTKNSGKKRKRCSDTFDAKFCEEIKRKKQCLNPISHILRISSKSPIFGEQSNTLPPLLLASSDEITGAGNVSIHYPGQSSIVFKKWEGCTANDLLQHVVQYGLFKLPQYKSIYLQDSSGALYLPYSPLKKAKSLFLVTV